MPASVRRRTAIAVAAALPAAALLFTAGPAATAAASYHVTQLITGKHLHHSFRVAHGAAKTEALTQPDDLTELGGHLFAGFQNGVGSMGEPSPDGNTSSTIVEFTASGRVLHQWDIAGKCDGLGADPAAGVVIATVNEDGNSSLYTISPGGFAPVHYRYDRPLAHHGGTDAVTFYHGRVLVSASAPGSTGKAAPQASYPALYALTLHPFSRTASLLPLFGDEATAVPAASGAGGKTVRLGLTDPDSSEVVPWYATRFAGDFMLNSQGDLQLLFWAGGGPVQELRISQSIDDSAWASSRSGRLYLTSGAAIDVVTGPFRTGEFLVAATPCNANSAPGTCPAPGFPANYLGQLNPANGHVSELDGAVTPKGMLFVG